MRKQWYDYDITELNESMFDESCETCETSGFKDDDMGDAPDTAMDDSEDDGFESTDDNSGFSESSDNDYIDSDWYDGEVEPSTIPQNKAEEDSYKNDPSKVDTTAIMRKDDVGETETVTAESFFDDINDDLF